MEFIEYESNIYYRRRLQNLTQKELAKRVGVARHQISMLEHGHILPSVELLNKIAKELKVLESELYPTEELKIILDYKK